MDIEYWNKFYNLNADKLNKCSDFCCFVINYFKEEKNINYILDAGCGNGRDSFELAKKYNVDGVDNSGFLPLSKQKNLIFLNDNFVEMKKDKYDLIYSRFTFHSITNEQHDIFLNNIKKNTFLAIEARSIENENDNLHFGKEHFRNYIEITYIKKILKKYNFDILFIKKGKDMAVYKNENPECIRVLCIKK